LSAPVRASGIVPLGSVSERPKERASKAREGSRPPWVQIPPLPLGDGRRVSAESADHVASPFLFGGATPKPRPAGLRPPDPRRRGCVRHPVAFAPRTPGAVVAFAIRLRPAPAPLWLRSPLEPPHRVAFARCLRCAPAVAVTPLVAFASAGPRRRGCSPSGCFAPRTPPCDWVRPLLCVLSLRLRSPPSGCVRLADPRTVVGFAPCCAFCPCPCVHHPLGAFASPTPTPQLRPPLLCVLPQPLRSPPSGCFASPAPTPRLRSPTALRSAPAAAFTTLWVRSSSRRPRCGCVRLLLWVRPAGCVGSLWLGAPGSGIVSGWSPVVGSRFSGRVFVRGRLHVRGVFGRGCLVCGHLRVGSTSCWSVPGWSSLFGDLRFW
jgi:hypothetical protein